MWIFISGCTGGVLFFFSLLLSSPTFSPWFIMICVISAIISNGSYVCHFLLINMVFFSLSPSFYLRFLRYLSKFNSIDFGGFCRARIMPLAITKASGVWFSLESIYWQFGNISSSTWKHSLSDWWCPNTFGIGFLLPALVAMVSESANWKNPRHSLTHRFRSWNGHQITIQLNWQYHRFMAHLYHPHH